MRRQTSSKPGAPELQVLDYQNVSNIVLPLVAASYALIFMVNAGPVPAFCASDPVQSKRKIFNGRFLLLVNLYLAC